MTEPIHGDKPIVLEETPGSKWYCQCGLSGNLPYCDGKHKEEQTGISPIKAELEQACKKAVCQCHRSADLPWCDGTHSRPESS